jgi:hypothetical protein
MWQKKLLFTLCKVFTYSSQHFALSLFHSVNVKTNENEEKITEISRRSKVAFQMLQRHHDDDK